MRPDPFLPYALTDILKRIQEPVSVPVSRLRLLDQTHRLQVLETLRRLILQQSASFRNVRDGKVSEMPRFISHAPQPMTHPSHQVISSDPLVQVRICMVHGFSDIVHEGAIILGGVGVRQEIIVRPGVEKQSFRPFAVPETEQFAALHPLLQQSPACATIPVSERMDALELVELQCRPCHLVVCPFLPSAQGPHLLFDVLLRTGDEPDLPISGHDHDVRCPVLPGNRLIETVHENLVRSGDLVPRPERTPVEGEPGLIDDFANLGVTDIDFITVDETCDDTMHPLER